MKKTAVIVLVAIVIFLAGAQLVRPARTNPPADAPLVISDRAVESILRRSCYDCHSNQTRWPWYSNVAPASWLVVKDVNEGREEMNFSNWKDPKGELRAEICEKVREGEMPLAIYVPLHAEARLTAEDERTLCAWASRSAVGASPTENEEDD
jgi:hypothetical protein